MSEEATENPLWQHILTVPRPMREVDFPRKDPVDGGPVCKMLMRVLSVAELQEAAFQAYTETKKRDDARGFTEGSPSWNEVFNNERALQLIFRACRKDNENPKERGRWAFFPPPNMLRKQLTGEEIGVLMREYDLLTLESGPMKREVSDAEADAILDEVVALNSAEPLAEYSWSALAAIVMRAADRLVVEVAA